jgi:hypothetical protein
MSTDDGSGSSHVEIRLLFVCFRVPSWFNSFEMAGVIGDDYERPGQRKILAADDFEAVVERQVSAGAEREGRSQYTERATVRFSNRADARAEPRGDARPDSRDYVSVPKHLLKDSSAIQPVKWIFDFLCRERAGFA